MSVPVWVEQTNGRFVASAVGHPSVRAEADSREAALAAVRVKLADRTAAGELVFIDLPPAARLPVRPLTPHEIELTREMVAELYRERDAQKAAEFPE